MFDEQILAQQAQSLDLQRVRERGIVVIYDAMLPEPKLDVADQVIKVVRKVHPSLSHDVFSVTFLPHTSSDVDRAIDGELGAVIDLRTTVGGSQET